ncbi:hypothetical protein ABHQ57_06565 [Tenacibaculum sp. ZH5_bin.1]|uniref:hypothetical protein n=1 Tax=Tenacibaculum TaxID=104267 RepID=UPI001430E4F7|nr:hypothetical protein [Tenacibaculum mesophilum]KAF9660104.1 hypothetical protein HBA12_07675 [Tenacibaculum mesophilum]
MKKIKFIIALLCISILAVQCTKEDNNLTNDNAPMGINSPSMLEINNAECYTVDGFGPNSYWADYIVNQSTTNFLKTEHNEAASFFGMGNVPLYLAGGDGTFNALSYSNGYVVWGEELLASALNYGNVAIAYVAAHEMAHQVQFRDNTIPSGNHVSATELEADGFGGYFIRRTYTSDWNTAAGAYNFSQTLAGPNGSSHGTAAQRRSAFRLGYLLGDNGTYSNRNFDANFFYYYDYYVKDGRLKLELVKPATIEQSQHEHIVAHLEELQKIASGEISEEEFLNLN